MRKTTQESVPVTVLGYLNFCCLRGNPVSSVKPIPFIWMTVVSDRSKRSSDGGANADAMDICPLKYAAPS